MIFMSLPFIILALLTLSSGYAAMRLRNLVHCALCLVLTFAGLAGLYLLLGAQFVGLAQILVYVGAVAILIVFAILLTRNNEPDASAPAFSASWLAGLAVTVLTAGTLIFAILTSAQIGRAVPPKPDASVKHIGEKLMTQYVLPLEVIALLLTVAMIGAVIIAMPDKRK